MLLTRLAWLGGLLGLAHGYGYYSGYTAGTGTDPGSSVPSTSAPYGNYSDPTAGPTYGTDPPPTGTVGTVASTGDPSGSGKLIYSGPTGIPSEYYYHHRKPKRNGLFGRGYGYQA